MRTRARALISVLGAMACGRPAVSFGPGSTLLPRARDAEVPVARARRALDPPRPTLSILAPDAPPMEVQQETEPIRWTLSNGLHVEHRSVEGTGRVLLQRVVIGPGAAAGAWMSVVAGSSRRWTSRPSTAPRPSGASPSSPSSERRSPGR